MHDIEFINAAQERGVTLPNKPITHDRFTRWGKNNRYSAKRFGDGLYVHDFYSDEELYYFPKNQQPYTVAQKAQRKAAQAKIRREAEAERSQIYSEAALDAETVWNSLQTIGKSSYLDKKRTQALGIRYGEGFIVIPARDCAGKLWSLQRIYDDPPRHLEGRNKDFLKDGKMRGHFHTIGAVDSAECAYICEGYATGASIFEATGKPAIIAFFAGNIAPVIQAIQQAYPKLKLVIAGDNDQWKDQNTGKESAEKAAQEFDCGVVIPEFPAEDKDRKPTDFNDLHCLYGIDAVKTQLQAVEFQESRVQMLSRLMALPPMDYALAAKAEASRLGIAKSAIDDEIKEHKRKMNEARQQDDIFTRVEPWPYEIDPAGLFEELAAYFKNYAILPEHSDIALTLWVAFTWCIEAAQTAPLLALYSPEKQCGKTTVLTMLGQLSYKPMPASNITGAALFRSIEKWQPTMLIDEADTFLKQSDDLRGILNSGHKRENAFVIRTVGENHEPKQFCTWGAKAIAMIGKLPETLHDRSIVIHMRRKYQGEKVESLRNIDKAITANLCRKLARFAVDYLPELYTMRPDMPENISDRAADNWEPLMAIASLGGEVWLGKAMNAACALSNRVFDAHSMGQELLADIQAIWNEWPEDKIPTAKLIDHLCADAEKPWAHYNKGQRITPQQLAGMLKEYGIQSKGIRMSHHKTGKGFERRQFNDAFARYLAPTAETATTPQHNNEINILDVADVEYEMAGNNLAATANSL